jgi:hypothetical protein
VKRRSRVWIVGGLAATGVVLGWVAASLRERRHRSGLFHPSPLRRLAAIGWLEGRGTAATLPLLRDYLVWEPHPMLRRRAARLLRRLEATL